MELPKLKEQIFGLKVEQPLGSVHLKIHHSRESIKDDHCFIAGTKVLTSRGNIDIENVRVGDYVLTRKKWKRVSFTGSRIKEVITKFGITATPDHPFITKNGIKTFKYVNALDTLYIWNEKQSCIMEGNITDTLVQNTNILETITGLILNGRKLLKHFIGKSGKIIMDPSQKVMQYTTKMEIHLITLLIILNSSLRKNIEQDIGLKKNQKQQKRILLNSQDLKLLNGTDLKKAEIGTRYMEKILGQRKKENKGNLRQIVYSVKKRLLAILSVKHIVQPIAMQNISEGKKRVYNLKVEGCNEFFANNVLVHNCDALANACYAAKRLLSVAGTFSSLKVAPKATEIPSERKLLVCPECEKVNYQDNNGYYYGYGSKANQLTRILCPMHKIEA